jgi:hypothetical protein
MSIQNDTFCNRKEQYYIFPPANWVKGKYIFFFFFPQIHLNGSLGEIFPPSSLVVSYFQASLCFQNDEKLQKEKYVMQKITLGNAICTCTYLPSQLFLCIKFDCVILPNLDHQKHNSYI